MDPFVLETGRSCCMCLIRQPKPEQMPTALRLRPVDEAGAVVQQSVIVHELHVAAPELHQHVELRIVRQAVEQIERLDVRRRQPRRLREALR